MYVAQALQTVKRCLDRLIVAAEKWKRLNWLLVPEEVRREAVPVERSCVSSEPFRLRDSPTYRTLKLRPLSSITLQDVIEADFSAGELLASRFARASNRSAFTVATTIALHDIAVKVMQLPLEAALAAHHTRTRTDLLCRDTTTTSARMWGRTLFPSNA